MKKIGTTNDGMLLEIGAEDLFELRAVLRARVFEYVDGIVRDLAAAVGLQPTATPVQSGGTNPPKREIKPPKREISGVDLGTRICEGCGKEYQAKRKDQRNCSKACAKKKAAAKKAAARPPRGSDLYHRCEQCDEKLPADAAPQRRFCDACVKARKDACPSAQKRKAPTQGGTRKAICETCKKTFEARVFGPVPHHCPACRPGGKKATAAAPAPALQTQPKALRPAMPSDDTGKAARLDAIRRIALKEAEELASDVIGGIEA
jgi:hypothetical protein